MKFIDTHTHLYDGETIELQNQHINRAIAAGVDKMYMPNCDSSTLDSMMAIALRYPNNCFPMMGLHPCYVKENFLDELAIVEQQLAQYKFSAIGEVGLDFYWDRSFDKEQKLAFEKQIDWAITFKLPVIIHSRSSTKECIDIIKRKQNGSLVSLFHCYSGTIDEAKAIVDLGGYLGIGGVITYKKTNLPDVLKEIPIENIVLETDAPYLAPVPYRGKPNESTFIPIIAEKIADLYEVSIEYVAEITSETAKKIFQ